MARSNNLPQHEFALSDLLWLVAPELSVAERTRDRANYEIWPTPSRMPHPLGRLSPRGCEGSGSKPATPSSLIIETGPELLR